MLSITRRSETLSMVSGTDVPGVLYAHGFGGEPLPWVVIMFDSDNVSTVLARFAGREDTETFLLAKAEQQYQ